MNAVICQQRRMNSILPNRQSRETFHRNNLADSTTASSIHSIRNIHELNVQEIFQFNYESERLKTFGSWPVPFLNPSSLAAAGFYYLKREDIVKCAFCGVEVGSWIEGDDPMKDHKKWAPSCKFVQNQPVGNIPLSMRRLENGNTSHLPRGNGYDICERIELRPSFDEDPTLLFEKLNIHQSKTPSFPKYSTSEARLKSFEMWPISLKLKPIKLSEAGFFYIGQGDQTVCYQCGGGLKNWKDLDDPWVEHARWFKNCDFILLSKGKSFVEACTKKAAEADSKSEENPRKSESEEEKKTQMTNIEQDAGNSMDNTECKICFNDDVGIVFLPCGHLVACVKCALSLSICAVCREDIKASVRVFLT